MAAFNPSTIHTESTLPPPLLRFSSEPSINPESLEFFSKQSGFKDSHVSALLSPRHPLQSMAEQSNTLNARMNEFSTGLVHGLHYPFRTRMELAHVFDNARPGFVSSNILGESLCYLDEELDYTDIFPHRHEAGDHQGHAQ